jgi:hypothetical protein
MLWSMLLPLLVPMLWMLCGSSRNEANPIIAPDKDNARGLNYTSEI